MWNSSLSTVIEKGMMSLIFLNADASIIVCVPYTYLCDYGQSTLVAILSCSLKYCLFHIKHRNPICNIYRLLSLSFMKTAKMHSFSLKGTWTEKQNSDKNVKLINLGSIIEEHKDELYILYILVVHFRVLKVLKHYFFHLISTTMQVNENSIC